MLDYLATAPVVIASTIGLWKVEAVRDVFVVDPTLLALGACAVLVFFSAVRAPKPLLGASSLFILLASFLPGLILASLAQPYSVAKSLQLYTYVPLLVLSGLQLINSTARRRAFTDVISVLGVAISIALILTGTVAKEDPARVALQDGNPIGLGRICVFAAICLMTLPSFGLTRIVRYFGAALCIYATMLTGSRGPIISLILAMLTVALICQGKRVAGASRLFRAMLALAFLAFAAYALSPDSRLVTAYGGETDTIRLELAQSGLTLAQQNPLGLGWGDFVLHMPIGYRIEAQGWSQYPHNILIEALVEGGLVALLGLLYILGRALVPLMRLAQAGSPTCLALLVTSVVGGLTSSDLTGNRTIWVLIGVGLASSIQARRTSVARDPAR